MRLIAQAEARRLTPADGCRHKRPFRALQLYQHTGSSRELECMLQGCVCTGGSVHGAAGMTKLGPGLDQAWTRSPAGALRGRFGMLKAAWLPVALARVSIRRRKRDAEPSLPIHMSVLTRLDV